MMRVLLWKEYREHRSIWLAMAVIAAMALIGLPLIFAPHGYEPRSMLRETLCAAALLSAWAYGLVCGAMLLAGEREERTLTFLDTLPALRRQLWVRKCLIGLGLVMAQVLVLGGLSLGGRLIEGPLDMAVGLVLLVLFGLFGYSWGLLFSANGQGVLNVIGLAILSQMLALMCMSCLVSVVAGILGNNRFGAGASVLQPILTLACVALLTLLPLVGSFRIFSAPDRLRGRSLLGRTARELPRARGSWSWLGALWLSWRQARRLALGICLFSLVGGFVLPAWPLLFWPVVTLGMGVLCGVTVFSDEQVLGSFRFLGDQRLPRGRIWLTRVAVRFGIAAVAALLVLAPSVVRELVRAMDHPSFLHEGNFRLMALVFQSGLLQELIPPWLFLSMWLVYGFCAGHLFGLLFRKPLVAFVVALGTSVLFVSVWLPSLLGGGLHGRQVWGVPMVLLIAARLLMRLWVTGRLVSGETFTLLGLAALACVGWDVGGIWYRVAEVPDVPDHFNMPQFVASVRELENRNEAGQRIRSALSQLENLRRPSDPQGPGEGFQSFAQQADEVLKEGWEAAGDPDLARWLDRMFDAEWPKHLAEAADLPLGLVEDPRRLAAFGPVRAIQEAHFAAVLLSVRGLQLQADGNDRAFVDNLQTGLALSRNLRHSSLSLLALIGRSVETTMLHGVDDWLEELDGHPELLRRALNILLEHEKEMPPAGEPQEKADYLIDLNALEDPRAWMKNFWPTPSAHGNTRDASREETEHNLVAMAWLVPWEKERHERLLRAAVEGDPVQARAALEKINNTFPVTAFFNRGHLRQGRNRQLCDLHASQLVVALRLYQAESGKPAESLRDLVRKRYLKSIPTDPFDGQPFRYRLSKGETILWPEENRPVLPPGAAAAGMPPGGAGGEAPPAGIAPEGGLPGGPAEVLGMAAGPGAALLEPALPGMGIPPPPVVEPTRTIPPGQGILWSVGEDGQDDGGKRRLEPNVQRTSPGEDRIYLVPLPPK